METKDIAPVGTDALFEKISALIEESRKRVAATSWRMSRREIIKPLMASRFSFNLQPNYAVNSVRDGEKMCWAIAGNFTQPTHSLKFPIQCVGN